MGADSKIEWTDHTFNPWWGCTKVSPGCDHCYAETLAKRYGHDVWGPGVARREFGDKHWAEPLKWDAAAAREGARKRVFCASMADVFDNEVPEEWRRRLFDLIERTPNLDWLLLTKRIGNVPKATDWRDEPHDNIWLGISVVNQEEADRDIPKLLAVPARVRFLSCEPLLGPITLAPKDRTVEMLSPWYTKDAFDPTGSQPVRDRATWLFPKVDWVIVGGESGPGARPMNPQWARDLRDQCADFNIPFFFKQWGEWTPGVNVDRQSGTVQSAHWFNDKWSFGRENLADGDGHIDDEPDLYCVGKKAAGRLLDGVEHNAFPLSQQQRVEP